MGAPEIIYEDRQLLVVVKPAGWLAQADGRSRLDLLAWSKSYLRQVGRKPGQAFVGLCHRLDRPVGGLTVLAKTSKAAGRLAEQFRERLVGKTYEALCLGRVQAAEKLLEAELVRPAGLTRPAGPGELGRRSALRFRRTGFGRVDRSPASRLEVELLTGFRHQIRAQLAYLGHPLLGDRLYGGSPPPSGEESIGLFAARLSFRHPIGGELLLFEARPPDRWPWNAWTADGSASC
jgi:23S rRNA pseudouridine1911/1915/1917 synthase